MHVQTRVHPETRRGGEAAVTEPQGHRSSAVLGPALTGTPRGRGAKTRPVSG